MGKLTAARVRAINAPGKYYDQHGLILRVAPGGSKQWVWRGTIRGRRRDIGLGAVAYTTLAEARDIAYHYRKVARAGGDPTAMRPDTTAPTFAEASEKVIEAHRGGWKDSGRSEDSWRSSLQRYAYSQIGSMPVDEITTADLARVLLPIWHEKRETARKVKTRLGVVMRWAIAEGHRSDDPAGPALTGRCHATAALRPSTSPACPTVSWPRCSPGSPCGRRSTSTPRPGLCPVGAPRPAESMWCRYRRWRWPRSTRPAATATAPDWCSRRRPAERCQTPR